MSKRLDVYLHGKFTAQVEQGKGGALSLHYTPEHIASNGQALSLALPIAKDSHTNKPVAAYLEGLIPESEAARESLAREFGVSSRSPFAILSHIGLDCAGAVQFVPSGIPLPTQQGLEPLSDAVIAERLARMRADSTAGWVLPRERWSLGGAQSKFALTQVNGQWYEPTGAMPTTHIIKPGISRLRHQALNEHVCLAAADLLEIEAAATEYREFEAEPAIVVERYDRSWDRGEIRRLHQEDLCQAMGILPTRKYESSGGPTASRIIQFLRLHSDAQEAELNVYRFVQGLMFNCLIGAPDAHAKNYSVLLAPSRGPRLAPLYDIASALAYQADDGAGGIPVGRNAVPEVERSAMKVAKASVFSEITARRWRDFADDNDLDSELIMQMLTVYTRAVPSALEQVFAGIDVDSARTLESLLLPPVRSLCESVHASI